MISSSLKHNKGSYKILFTILGVFFLLFSHSCVEEEVTIFQKENEPPAAIGFNENELIVDEGGEYVQVQVNTSKLLFDEITFDLEVVKGDLAGVVFSDIDGDAISSFTIDKGLKSVDFKVGVEGDGKYTGDRKVVFKITNLVGDGVFLPESNVGGNEKRLFVEFELTIVESDPIPPAVGFTDVVGEIAENSAEVHKAVINFTKPATKPGSFDIVFAGTAVADTDYLSTASNGKLTVDFEAGAEVLEVEITPIDNEIIDGNRTVILTIENLSEGYLLGEVNEYELTIIDDDLPIIERIILAEADAWTRGKDGSGRSDQNGGSKREVIASVGNTNDDYRESYIRFDLGETDPQSVIEAKIILTTVREDQWDDGETNYGGVTTQALYHVTDDTWGELTITANNKPDSESEPIATYTSEFLIGKSGLTNIEHEYDVTAMVQVETDGKLSVRYNTLSNTLGKRLMYAAREHENGNGPKLIIREIDQN